MKRLYLTLEDGNVFEGQSINGEPETAGLLSFYTGVVGYQEVITDPANLGKIVLFTYPLIGNYGVNPQDAESSSITVKGLLCKEYPPYYSNFRAKGSLADYVGDKAAFGAAFDTRAILVHLRDQGEMLAALSGEPLSAEAVKARASETAVAEPLPDNKPIACAQAHPIAKAFVVDLGASKSFYRNLAALGIDATVTPDDADLTIVSDAPYQSVESPAIIARVKSAIAGKPAMGIGHGSAIVAQACGGKVRRLSFGDHGVNIPVAYSGGGRNEITAQNHNYEVVPGGGVEALFTNVHDGSCEGYAIPAARAAGLNFMPGAEWLEVVLKSVGVK